MLRAYETKGRGFCPRICTSTLMMAELRKTQPFRCRGAIYPPQEQSKVVRSTRRTNPKSSDPLVAAKQKGVTPIRRSI
ncbi:hypothetical protein TNCV_3431651 [Trichonephila clavipes]|nr:hypothetical protein TNCV_3431651 [Trichonephila clavipes]